MGACCLTGEFVTRRCCCVEVVSMGDALFDGVGIGVGCRNQVPAPSSSSSSAKSPYGANIDGPALPPPIELLSVAGVRGEVADFVDVLEWRRPKSSSSRDRRRTWGEDFSEVKDDPDDLAELNPPSSLSSLDTGLLALPLFTIALEDASDIILRSLSRSRSALKSFCDSFITSPDPLLIILESLNDGRASDGSETRI